MIEFKMKPFSPEDDWRIINDLQNRTHLDFEFSYCDYRIGDVVYEAKTGAFLDALKKEQLWMKLKK